MAKALSVLAEDLVTDLFTEVYLLEEVRCLWFSNRVPQFAAGPW